MQRFLRALSAFAILIGTSACPGEAVNLDAPAPELAGLDPWVNSAPLTMEGLRGRVVLVNFWTFGCHNCRNTLPKVKSWHERYADRGLVIVGIHTPELEFERSPAAVEAAVREHGIAWPVAIDGAYRTWNAYGNRYWPAFYFVDKRGVVRHARFGEGGYADSERWIERLLAEP
jgi:thiol-disulfide isomerase/thioredoxin